MTEATITLEDLAELSASWHEYSWYCTACGETGVVSYQPGTKPPDVNFFPCTCGEEGKKIKINSVGKA